MNEGAVTTTQVCKMLVRSVGDVRQDRREKLARMELSAADDVALPVDAGTGQVGLRQDPVQIAEKLTIGVNEAECAEAFENLLAQFRRSESQRCSLVEKPERDEIAEKRHKFVRATVVGIQAQPTVGEGINEATPSQKTDHRTGK